MKRIRLHRWSAQLLSSRTISIPCCQRQQIQQLRSFTSSVRSQLSSADSTSEVIDEDDIDEALHLSQLPYSTYEPEFLPSPLPERAVTSAKLAALHARIALPKKLPLQTIARALVDRSADSNTRFNNATLAQVGGSIISYHIAEWLMVHYPRLPMTVLFAASYAYNGPATLKLIAKEWGVEEAAEPGGEIDPGLLQFSHTKPGVPLNTAGGASRPDKRDFYRRGLSSRVVYDDEFGDTLPNPNTTPAPVPTEHYYASFVKAVVGGIYVHAGRQAAKDFVKQHILSRHLNISSLFAFKEPIKELSRLCRREELEYPVARILSETGRRTRSPVFVVGIFSGDDKLGEGVGPSLNEARIRASVNTLKAWYLYSPGKNLRVPSDTEGEAVGGGKKKEWDPVHIDIGEIVE